jgi:calnexin
LIDGKSCKKGSLLEDFVPPVESPAEIDDSNDSKPLDWVEEAEIEDLNAEKPSDWDETQPQYIPDPDQQDPPEDWLVNEAKFISDPEAKHPQYLWRMGTADDSKCEMRRSFRMW